MDKNEQIRKWLAGNFSDSEEKEFSSGGEFDKTKRLLQAADAFKAPEYNAADEYQKLAGKLFRNNKKISLYNRITPVLRIAAVFVFAVLMAWFVYDRLDAPQSSPEWIAEQKELYLPDSSFVALNADSRIRLSDASWEDDRSLELEGEAFFSVKEGSQFKVISQQGTVTVLGTEFDVKDRSNYYEVSCYSGLVQVITEEQSLKLNPGSSFRIINRKAEKFNGSTEPEPAWLKGESSFKSVALKFVIEELERQHKVAVETQEIDLNQTFTGSFSNKDLTIALESVTFPLNLEYKINGEKIILSVEGN